MVLGYCAMLLSKVLICYWYCHCCFEPWKRHKKSNNNLQELKGKQAGLACGCIIRIHQNNTTSRRARCRVADHWRPVCHYWLNPTHGQHTLHIEYLNTEQRSGTNLKNVCYFSIVSLLHWATDTQIDAQFFSPFSHSNQCQMVCHNTIQYIPCKKRRPQKKKKRF